jgi:hypothetical protein
MEPQMRKEEAGGGGGFEGALPVYTMALVAV